MADAEPSACAECMRRVHAPSACAECMRPSHGPAACAINERGRRGASGGGGCSGWLQLEAVVVGGGSWWWWWLQRPDGSACTHTPLTGASTPLHARTISTAGPRPRGGHARSREITRRDGGGGHTSERTRGKGSALVSTRRRAARSISARS